MVRLDMTGIFPPFSKNNTRNLFKKCSGVGMCRNDDLCKVHSKDERANLFSSGYREIVWE